jgi:hypothetical protein
MVSSGSCRDRAKDKVSLFFAGVVFVEKCTMQDWIWFPRWSEVLARERLPAIHQKEYRTAIISHLRHCKDTGQRATVPSAREFMARTERERSLARSQLELWKEAIRWFFRSGRQQAGKNVEPPRRKGTKSGKAE